jgi:hypothetical protein
MWGFRLEVV